MVEEADFLGESRAKVVVADVARDVEGDPGEECRVDISQDEPGNSNVDKVQAEEGLSMGCAPSLRVECICTHEYLETSSM